MGRQESRGQVVPAGRGEQQVCITTDTGMTGKHARIAVLLDRQAQALHHPPHHRVPWRQGNADRAEQQQPGVALPHVLELVRQQQLLRAFIEGQDPPRNQDYRPPDAGDGWPDVAGLEP